MQFSRQKDDI